MDILYSALFISLSSSFTFFPTKVVNKTTNRLLISQMYFSTLHICNCDDKSLKFMSKNIEIHKGDSCYYYLRGIDKTKNTQLILYNSDKNDTIKYYSFSFTDTVIKPILKFKGLRRMELGPVISKKTDSVSFVSPFIDKFNQKIKYNIVSFKLSILYNNNIIYKRPVLGNTIPKDFKKYLDILRPKDEIIFSNIILKDQYGNRFKIAKEVIRVDGT